MKIKIRKIKIEIRKIRKIKIRMIRKIHIRIRKIK
jgi:hypothetical protein